MAIEAPAAEEEDNHTAVPTAFAISRPEAFLPPPALVIFGGGFNKNTIGSVKRKFEELEKVCSVNPVTVSQVKKGSLPLAFYMEEVSGGSPNYQIPLLVRACMANFDVHRILMDQGSSCDVMYSGLFKTLQLMEKNLVPYVGADLQGFNGSTTKPWGYVDLIDTFGEEKAMKSVKVQFLVVECPSLYNCIIGITTLAELFAVSSTIHLKLKYYIKDGQVATINGDIAAARRCFEAAAKNLTTVVTPKKKKAEQKLPAPGTEKIYRPIPDGDFEIIPLGEDPTKGIKIGTGLPDLVKKQLEACLKQNAKLFAWSAAEMPGIDPEVACHQLTIDPRASAVVQRRMK
ncbi:hypothetical protein A2U01_0011504 [Trifolium medium]|uniref:Uncharacterized protein n=1 Tax=Trifolium medium TaxID=97028 RepID=A0A392MV71_9FABA|nr:hypothetical protein [Trifolium medium]